jgi:hypothetical protein
MQSRSRVRSAVCIGEADGGVAEQLLGLTLGSRLFLEVEAVGLEILGAVKRPTR